MRSRKARVTERTYTWEEVSWMMGISIRDLRELLAYYEKAHPLEESVTHSGQGQAGPREAGTKFQRTTN